MSDVAISVIEEVVSLAVTSPTAVTVSVTEQPVTITATNGPTLWGGILGDIADQSDLQAALADVSPVWGAITGTLADQSDLETALDDRALESDLTAHEAATTSVHGIADTSALATTSDVSAAITTAEGYTDTGLATKQNALGYTPANIANNLSDLASSSTARTNLGLGTAATQASSAFLQPANNLSDVNSASTALTNLGAQASLGYTPVNKAGDTMTGSLAISKTGGGITFSASGSGEHDIVANTAGGEASPAVRVYAKQSSSSDDSYLLLGRGSGVLSFWGGRAQFSVSSADNYHAQISSDISIKFVAGTNGVVLSARPFRATTTTATDIIFAVTAAASQTGDLAQWQNSSAAALSGVNSAGQPYLPTTSGAPTNTPTHTGAMAFDPATNKLWVYGSSGWVSTTLS